MKLSEFTAAMREAGVRSATMATSTGLLVGPDSVYVTFASIELEPAAETIPAPPLEFEPPAEDKPAGSCSAPGCNDKAGFHFAPHLCERHGLGQLGVKT